jgi:cysteine desulfuration protein SufE
MSIEKKIEEFKDDLELFDDELEKYQYIIDLGKKTK